MTQHQLKLRSDLHLARKIWHAFGVLVIAAIYYNVSHIVGLQLITLAALLSLVIDIVRLQSQSFNKIVIGLMHPFMRESERERFAGTTFLLVGVFLTILLFPKPIVTISLLFLALADPLASYVGVLYGKDKILGNKSLQGTLAAFFVCLSTFALFCYFTNIMMERLLVVSVLAGLIGATAELLPVGKIDDNFTMPLISALLLWVMFNLFGGI